MNTLEVFYVFRCVPFKFSSLCSLAPPPPPLGDTHLFEDENDKRFNHSPAKVYRLEHIDHPTLLQYCILMCTTNCTQSCFHYKVQNIKRNFSKKYLNMWKQQMFVSVINSFTYSSIDATTRRMPSINTTDIDVCNMCSNNARHSRLEETNCTADSHKFWKPISHNWSMYAATWNTCFKTCLQPKCTASMNINEHVVIDTVGTTISECVIRACQCHITILYSIS